MERQICGHCREEKDLSEYSASYRGRKGTWCRACMRSRYKPKPKPARPEVPDGFHYCTKCKEVRPRSDFYVSGDELRIPCKVCYREWHRGRYVPKSGATDEPRACAHCGTVYQPKNRRPSIYCSMACGITAYSRTRERRDVLLRRKYGIGADDYDLLLAEQGGGCALCGVKPEDLTKGRWQTFLHVDHDHESGRVRGLLCPDHNLLLGRFGDSVEMFRAVVAYLEHVPSELTSSS